LNSEIIRRDLELLLRILISFDLLEEQGKGALYEAIAQLKPSRQQSSRIRSREEAPWKFEIPSEKSLLFVELPGQELQPDLYCSFGGPSTDEWPWKEQSLVIRVWSRNNVLTSRANWDSLELTSKLKERNWQRVVLRFHLDRAKPADPVPIHHFQIGGVPVEHDRELCWLLPQVDIPRLPYHPVDIVLACQIIVASFFPEAFLKLCSDTEWLTLVRRAEQFNIKHYSSMCYDFCKTPDVYPKQTLLMRLWNS
jgi:hypothetical protein